MGGIKKILVLLLLIFTVIVMMQVVARYILHSPLTWSEQIARYLFIWMIMLGTPLAMHMKVHIAFDMILKRFPPFIKLIIETVHVVLMTAFSCYWFAKSMDLVLRSTETIAAGIEIPMNYIYAAQPAGAALLFFVCCEALADLKNAFRSKGEAEKA
jgi:TRAP-type C4-dicarboxylate transport system permease small subunit